MIRPPWARGSCTRSTSPLLTVRAGFALPVIRLVVTVFVVVVVRAEEHVVPEGRPVDRIAVRVDDSDVVHERGYCLRFAQFDTQPGHPPVLLEQFTELRRSVSGVAGE